MVCPVCFNAKQLDKGSLRFSYCTLAHGKVLRDRFYDAGTVAGMVTDHRRAGLDPAGARCFFSTVPDALGAEPDAAYRTELEPELQQALAAGRPIAAAPPVTPAAPA